MEHIGNPQLRKALEAAAPDRAMQVALFFAFQATYGYERCREIPGGRWAGVTNLAYTCPIVTGNMFDDISIVDTWCYHCMEDAVAALDAWNGVGEPAGWHRDKRRGLRRSEDPEERDENDKRAGAVGVIYRRW